MYRAKTVDITTGEETWRDLTVNEIKEVELEQAKAEEFIAEQAVKAEQRAGLLAKLGITEDEAKLLLG